MEYDIGTDESVHSAVRRAVSAVEGRPIDSLPPLADVVDPEALDTLFDTSSSGRSRLGARLEFYYSDCHLTIDGGECLTIQLLEPSGRQGGQAVGETAEEEQTPEADGQWSPDGDGQGSGRWKRPGSRVCVVCQQPIDLHELQRERGELVHPECRAELRCGVSIGKPDSE